MSNKKSLAKELAEWLESQGYPLEMIVAAELQKAGFTVSLSDFYEDYDTGELREIDVTALKWSNLDRASALQVCWRIECKLARDKPWIVFVSNSQPEQFLPSNIFSSLKYKCFLFEAFKQDTFRSRLLRLPLLKPHKVDHGITQAFTSGQDVPYKAVMSAVKASIDRVAQFDRVAQEVKYNSVIDQKRQFSCVVFPVIIIDGKLFECSIEENDELRLYEVQSSVL